MASPAALAVQPVPQAVLEPVAQAVSEPVAQAVLPALLDAARTLVHGLESAGQAAGQAAIMAVGTAVESTGKAAEAAGTAIGKAAEMTGPETASSLGQPAFTWSGYIQAIGILFLLLAGLWLGVWLIRRYGKFNFLPRPGALPRDALVMEAQMPLGPRKGLMVVRFLNRRLLLGVTDQHITLLTEESAHHEPSKEDFQDIMEAARSTAVASPAYGSAASRTDAPSV